ncbi:MAG TPA: MerR family transcriptional regulator [Phenylobacterium sp.]|nr:MerR family transcriptional regulator [Phenylobacterium sp.]
MQQLRSWTSTYALDRRARMSDLSRMWGVTPRALRFYEECGLIDADRDRRNRRLYDRKAVDRLELIVELRKAGVGLNDIREVLSAEGDAAEALQIAMGKLDARRSELHSALGAVDHVAERLRTVRAAAA